MGFWSSFVDNVAGPLVDLGGNLLGNHSAKQEAQANRDWQADMSNTAIQRRVADLKKAGLNPLLAVSNASSGASTPSGAQANIQHYKFNPDTVNVLSNARLLQAQAKAQEQDNELHEIRKKGLQLDNRLRDVRASLVQAQSDNERVKIIQNTLKNQGIELSNEQAWHALDVLKIQYDINHKGLFNEDNLADYPGYIAIKNGELSKSPFGIIGSMVSDGVSSTAQSFREFKQEMYKFIDEIEKNRKKYENEHWR